MKHVEGEWWRTSRAVAAGEVVGLFNSLTGELQPSQTTPVQTTQNIAALHFVSPANLQRRWGFPVCEEHYEKHLWADHSCTGVRGHPLTWLCACFTFSTLGGSHSDVGLAFKCSLFDPIRSRDKCVFIL